MCRSRRGRSARRGLVVLGENRRCKLVFEVKGLVERISRGDSERLDVFVIEQRLSTMIESQCRNASMEQGRGESARTGSKGLYSRRQLWKVAID